MIPWESMVEWAKFSALYEVKNAKPLLGKVGVGAAFVGSSVSLASFSRLGSTVSISDTCWLSGISVLSAMQLGSSSLSARNVVRIGVSASILSESVCESSLSVLSNTSVRGIVRPGKALGQELILRL